MAKGKLIHRFGCGCEHRECPCEELRCPYGGVTCNLCTLHRQAEKMREALRILVSTGSTEVAEIARRGLGRAGLDNIGQALRVLVTVRGGVAEVYASGADVRVIDFDIDGHGDSRDVDGARAAVTLGAHFEYGPEAERLWNACTAGGIRVGKATEENL